MPGAKLADLNSVLSCVLCGGYLVDATTIVQCLHSFCRACIVHYLATSNLCPICDVPVHKSKPLNYIRPDKTLQDLVYKMVPGLYQKEMRKRREFYDEHPNAGPEEARPEDKGLLNEKDRIIFSPDDHISLSLEYITGRQETKSNIEGDGAEEKKTDEEVQRRFLNCPAALTVGHLQKFLRMKYSLSPNFKIDILYMNDVLYEGYSLMDIAYIYTWKRESPLRMFFRISARPPKLPSVQHVHHPSEEQVTVENKSLKEMQMENAREEGAQSPKSDVAVEKPASPGVPQEPTPSSPALGLCEESDSKQKSASDITHESKADREGGNRNPVFLQKATAAHIPEQALTSPCDPPSREKGDDGTTGVDASKSATVPETGTEKSTKIVSLVQSTAPQRKEQAAEPVAEAQLPPLPPPLPKFTLSTLDRNSNKIIIQTKDAPTVAAKTSPPMESHGDKAKKPRRKESSKKKSPERLEKRYLPDEVPEVPPSKRRKQESEGMKDDSRHALEAKPSSPRATSPQASQTHRSPQHQQAAFFPRSSPVSKAPEAHPQAPRTTSSAQHDSVTMTRTWQDTRPLDLSMAHRSMPQGPRSVELAPPFPRPRGRPPLPLPMISQPLPKQTSSYKVISPVAPMFHKTPVTAASSHHHHHHHHHRNSKHLFKGSNLTCINTDPNAFHPRIVIKNVPPRGPNGFRRV